jgi:RNA polymerase sigma-70 factor, ECF subfamily
LTENARVSASVSHPLPKDDDQRFRKELLASVQALRAFAISLVAHPDRADDLVQETLVKAWQHRASYRLGTNLGAWLFTILRNEFYSQIRKRRREVEDGDGAYAARVALPPAQDGHMDLNDMQAALMKLPVDQREAVLLVSASDMSYEDAAAICGVAVGTVKSRVNRGRTKLAEILGIRAPSELGPDEDVKAVVGNNP